MAKKNSVGGLVIKYSSELEKKERQLLLAKKKYLTRTKQDEVGNDSDLRLLKKAYLRKCREYIELWLKKRQAEI